MTLNCPSPRFLRLLFVALAWMGLFSGPSRSEVSASVQLTLAGAAVGGAAWALSVSWAEAAGLLAPSPAADLMADPEGRALTCEGLLLYVPLLHIPFP